MYYTRSSRPSMGGGQAGQRLRGCQNVPLALTSMFGPPVAPSRRGIRSAVREYIEEALMITLLCEFTQRRSNSSRFCENDASVKLRLRVMAAYDSPRMTHSTRPLTLLGVVGLSWFGRGGRVRFEARRASAADSDSSPTSPATRRAPRRRRDKTNSTNKLLRTPRPRSRRSGACSPRRSRCSAALVDASSSVSIETR